MGCLRGAHCGGRGGIGRGFHDGSLWSKSRGFKVRRVELRLLGGIPTCVAYYFSNELSQGHQVVGVFSAMFAVTDRLLAAVATAEAADEEGVLRAERDLGFALAHAA